MSSITDNESPLASVEREGSTHDQKLRKVLSRQGMFFLAYGGVVGSGWLLAAPAASFYAGPSAIFSWIIAAAIMIFVLITYAEITSYIPKSGSLVRYPVYTYGPLTSFFLSWLYFLAVLVVPSLEGIAVTTYMTAYVPGLFNGAFLTNEGIAITAVLTFAMFLINYAGVKLLGRISIWAGYWKFIIPVLTFTFLLAFSSHSANFGLSGSSLSFFPYGVKGMFYAIPASGIIWAFLGFRQPFEFAGETKLPGKKLLTLSIYSFVAVAIIYVLLQVAFVGAVNWSAVGVSPGNWVGLESTKFYTTPYFEAMRVSQLPLLGAFASLLLVDAWVSPMGCGWIYVGNSARDLYGLGAMGFLPKAFLRLNKYKVPIVGLVVTLIASILFYLPFPSWYAIVGFAGTAGLIALVLGGPMAIVLRRYVPKVKGAIRIPFIQVAGMISWVGGILIVYWAGFYLVYAMFSFGFVSLPFLYFTFLPNMKLIKNRKKSYTIGIVEFVISLILSVFGYYYLLAPSSTQTTTQTLEYFALYFIVFLAMSVIATWITLREVEPKDKKSITSFYWLLMLMFALLIVSFFGSYGVITVVQFPWDVVLMIIISIPIYFWAIKSGYETDYLKELKKELVAAEES